MKRQDFIDITYKAVENLNKYIFNTGWIGSVVARETVQNEKVV